MSTNSTERHHRSEIATNLKPGKPNLHSPAKDDEHREKNPKEEKIRSPPSNHTSWLQTTWKHSITSPRHQIKRICHQIEPLSSKAFTGNKTQNQFLKHIGREREKPVEKQRENWDIDKRVPLAVALTRLPDAGALSDFVLIPCLRTWSHVLDEENHAL